MTDIAGLARLIEPEVKSLGYDLVRVAMIGGTSDPTLQVMAERPDTRQLDLADCETHLAPAVRSARRCATRSRAATGSRSARPGIDRPLTRLKDYRRLGRPRSAHHASPSRATAASNSRARSRASTATRSSSTDKERPDACLPFSDISSAKLLLTDKLINATAPLSTEGADTIQTVEE